jgi:hypothetical protein
MTTLPAHPRCLAAFALSIVICVATDANAQLVSTPSARNGIDWKGAIGDSFKQLMIEHAIRVATQNKTRRELKGPFWSDYKDSLRVPSHWEDGDAWWVNYIGHPIHGAAAGYSWLDHDPGAPTEISLSSRYWTTRSYALAWSAVYSAQFEFGPLSEASIGNVGMRPETTGWVDHVTTPIGAFGLIVAEDALDRFFVKWIERRTHNRAWRASLRMLFNPARTMANLTSGKRPWNRGDRSIGWR